MWVQGQNKAIIHNIRDSTPIKIDSLKAAIVTAAARPHLNGDTIEFNVTHLTMPPNAVVEELLRRLPGLQIDVFGNITYNGEKINHLLVDGQDIFGSTPTLVTRNFDANKIASVQILDRKSDNAIFTGIDDGSRTKTINLVLKEDARNGYFGKVEAGGNTDKYYNCSAILAAFRKKEQFTAIGMATNTGVLGTNSELGGLSFYYGISDALGASAGIGIPTFNAVALHYANTWSPAGSQMNINFESNHFFTQPVTTTQSLQTESDSVYGQNQRSQSVNTMSQQWLDMKYEWILNSNSEFMFGLRGMTTQNQNQFNASGSSTFNDMLVNSSSRTIQDQLTRQDASGSVAWKIRIGKNPLRVLAITASLDKLNETTSGYIKSLDKFYQSSGAIQSIDTVNQRKVISSQALSSEGTLNYAQPLWPTAIFGVSYGWRLNSDRPLQNTYGPGDGSYKETIDSLSSNLTTQILNQHLTVNLQGKYHCFNYTLGNDWVIYGYHQDDLIADSAMSLHYLTWAPKVLFTYTPNRETNVDFQYIAATQEPAISQLAPIRNNDNPLFITLGNPNLKPSLNQSFKLVLHRFSTWLFSLILNYTSVSNAITTKTSTDSLGRQISQPVNVDGGKDGKINLFIGRKILGFNAQLHLSGIYSQSLNYVNTDLNQNSTYTSGFGLNVNRYIIDRVNLQFVTSFNYFHEVSSINTAAPVHYWSQKHTGALTFWLPMGFELGTNATYTWQEKTSSFANSTSVLLWNSYVSRNFLHNKLTIKGQFNNMLNQNAGISRTSSTNINTETSTNILGRFWMLSAIYHFDKQFKHRLN